MCSANIIFTVLLISEKKYPLSNLFSKIVVSLYSFVWKNFFPLLHLHRALGMWGS